MRSLAGLSQSLPPPQAVKFNRAQLHTPGVLAHTFTAPTVPEAHFTVARLHSFSSTFWTEHSSVGEGLRDFTPHKKRKRAKKKKVEKRENEVQLGGFKRRCRGFV